jgi:hypothetical protein
MKTLVVFVAVGVVIVAPAFAQTRSKAVTKGYRVHHYAGRHYAPRYYPRYGYGNGRPDFPSCLSAAAFKC